MKSGFKQIVNKTVSSSLLRSSGIYTITSFVNAAIPLLLVPLLTSKLTPADYGIVAMFQLAVSVIYPFISINFESAISRKYYDTDNTNLAEYIGNCFIVSFCCSIFLTLILFIFLGYFQQVTQIPAFWLQYILLMGVCQFITTTLLIVYQVQVKPIKFGLLQIFQTVFNLGLTLYLILQLNKKWEGRLEAQITTGILTAIISVLILYKTKLLKFKINRSYIKHALKFGVPLIPHAIGGILFTGIDRFFLTNLIGLEQTGNYTVAYQLGAVVGLLTTSFNNAYVPWLYQKLSENKEENKIKLVKFTYLYFIILTVGAISLIYIFPFLVSIFVNKSFNSVNTYSLFIILGFVFQGMYFMVTNYISYAQKTYIQAALTICVALLKIPITYFAIKQFGAIGASISFCFTFFTFFIATWVYSNKIYPMPWLMVTNK